VQPPAGGIAATPAPAVSPESPLAELLPKMSLEIRAAFDASLQREIAALRGFVGGKLDTHAERVQGDLAALLPAPRTPEVDASPMIPERRVSSIIGWTLALLALSSGAALGWLWWGRGAEIAALRTDLAAAYTELEELRARPAIAPPAAVVDANVVTPAADADAAHLENQTLVPDGAAVAAPPADIQGPAAADPAQPTPMQAAPMPAASSSTPADAQATASSQQAQ
jgi:hypothetical protein